MLLSLTLALLLGSSGRPGTTSTYVDVIELNHQFNYKGELSFDQIIFWGRNPVDGKYNVRSWTLTDSCYPITVDGITRFENKDYRVHSRVFRETWTQYDPEAANKKVWPEGKRESVPLKRAIQPTRQVDDNDQAPNQ